MAQVSHVRETFAEPQASVHAPSILAPTVSSEVETLWCVFPRYRWAWVQLASPAHTSPSIQWPREIQAGRLRNVHTVGSLVAGHCLEELLAVLNIYLFRLSYSFEYLLTLSTIYDLNFLGRTHLPHPLRKDRRHANETFKERLSGLLDQSIPDKEDT